MPPHVRWGSEAVLKLLRPVKGGSQVHFKVVNSGCPSDEIDTVTVGAFVAGTSGSLNVTEWSPTNPIRVKIPVAGSTSERQTLEFKVAGLGAVTFEVSIIACNNRSCDDARWSRSPNHVPLTPVSYP